MNKTLSCILILLSLYGSGQTRFYDESTIQRIEVHFDQANWDYILDTAKMGKDGYVMAKWVYVNGVYFDSVGVKYKGNSSYDSTFKKNPIHFELDAFKNQDYSGIKDIKLSNAYADPSMVREVLAYNIARTYMEAPQSNFAQLYINSTYIGLYTNTEAINKSFCNNHFYSKNGVFVKGNPNLTPSPNVKSNLKYLVGDSSAYFNYYEMKSDHGWKQLQALCDTLTNNPNAASAVMDMDRATWMLAFNTLLINLDSYTGVFAQNYYMYKDQTGRFSPLIWDLNMSFGGFPYLGNLNSSLGNLSISTMQTLPINIHATDPYWPLINVVNNNATYKKMYVAHMRTIIKEFFANNLYVLMFNFYQSTIDVAVASDSKKFYSYSQFQSALTGSVPVQSYFVPGIQTLMLARVAYLQSTPDFTNATPTISSINTSAPQLNGPVTVTGMVTNAGSNSVYLGYRFSPTEKFTRAQMFDDGAHGDAAANDNIFGSSFTLSSNHAQYYIYAENANAGIFSPERAEHEFYSLDLYKNPEVGQVTINEFLADNESDVKNEFHLNQDWIELYNLTPNALSLVNYCLSDDSDDKPKYTFPKTTVIPANGFLTVWADNIVSSSGQIHSNFKLNNSDGTIVLSNGGYKILDTYNYGNQESDVSIGRCPDGYGSFSAIKLPSFGLSNCITGIAENNMDANIIKIYPNPANELFTISNTSGKEQNISISDIVGKLIYSGKMDELLTLNTCAWQNGLYIVSCSNSSSKLIVNH